MKCPLRIGRYVREKDDECSMECAWLIGDGDGAVACSIPALLEVLSHNALACQNYYTLRDDDEEDESAAEF